MRKIITASALAAAFCSLSAHAAPDEYIYPARVEAGEREIDIKFGTRNMRDNAKNRSFGDLGRWDHWVKTKEQGHRIGPAIFGTIALDSHQALKYNAAYLMGRTRIDDAAYRGNTFRMQLEYEC